MALAWKGYYWQFGQQHPMQFTAINIQLQPAGSITGQGNDEVGIFRIEGCFHPELTICRFVKSYLGQHEVYYEGVYHEESKEIKGNYAFSPGGNDGAFQLSH